MALVFPKLILVGRPASGKSEIIDYLKKSSIVARQERFRMGDIIVFDDFPMLWTWFEEDDILEKKFNLPRLHSTPDGYFKDKSMWDLLIERINLEYEKSVKDLGEEYKDITRIFEFARGTQHGGYKDAFARLSDHLLKGSCVMYVKVSFEESIRKNKKRYNPDKPHSILEHGLEDEKMEKLYKEDDWEELSKNSPTHLNVRGIEIPYITFENENSITENPKLLGPVLEERLNELWKLYYKVGGLPL